MVNLKAVCYYMTYQSLSEWPVHFSAWISAIPTLWSSSAELSRTLSVERDTSKLKSPSAFRLPAFALENSWAHSQLIPFPISGIIEQPHGRKQVLQDMIIVPYLRGHTTRWAVLWCCSWGRGFVKTMKIYFVFMKIWKEICSLKPALNKQIYWPCT